MTAHQFIKDVVQRLGTHMERIERAGAAAAEVDPGGEFVQQLRELDKELKAMRLAVVRQLGIATNPGPLSEGDQALQDQDAPCHCCHCIERRRRQQEEYSLAAAFYGLPHQF